MAGTLATHRQHVYSVILTGDEIAALRADTGAHGVSAETERMHVEVVRLSDLWAGNEVDWTSLGSISQVLFADGGPTPSTGDAGVASI